MLWFSFLYQKLWMKFRQYALAHLLKHCFWPPVYHLRKGEGLGEWTKRKPELGFNFPDKPLKVQQDIMLLSCQWPLRQQHWRVFGCPWQLIFNLKFMMSRSRSTKPINNQFERRWQFWLEHHLLRMTNLHNLQLHELAAKEVSWVKPK